MKHHLLAASIVVLAAFASGCSDAEKEAPNVTGAFAAEVWADNWFAMYVGDELVGEDSVPITTERSFNKETFGFDAEYPFKLNVVVKDFKENDTGLEYIGEMNQQMGDGGFIAQITDNVNGGLVVATDANWKCLVIHQAPLDKSCEKSASPETDCMFTSMEEPDGWKATDYDFSAWSAATEYDEQAVGPKDGYDEVNWDGAAKLIWGSDLETDNTLLCSVMVEAP